MKTTAERYGFEIASGAIEAGATREMIAAYDLTRDDCNWIRAEERASLSDPSVHIEHRPETEEEEDAILETVDWRILFADVEQEVRALAYMAPESV